MHCRVRQGRVGQYNMVGAEDEEIEKRWTQIANWSVYDSIWMCLCASVSDVDDNKDDKDDEDDSGMKDS